MHRFTRLWAALVQYGLADVFALAVDRWMEEIDLWLAIVFGEEDDRETRNHNPWGDADVMPLALEQ